MSIHRLCTVSVFAWLLFFGLRLPVDGHPTASAGVVVLGPQPPALSSGLGIDVLGIPTGNNVPGLPGPDIDANRYGPGVLVGFGQVVYDQVDLVIQGRDAVTTLVIARRHLSRRNQENSLFGPAWAFNYRHTIARVGDDDAVTESFGRTDWFAKVSDNVWEGAEGRFDRLTYDSTTAKYTLRMPYGTLLEFAADDAAANKPGHLTRITSPNGNTLIFSYETAANQPDILKRKLLTITESFGRAIEFSYTDTDYPAGVSKIRDFTGREVLYDYNGTGQLETVSRPVVANTGGLNDFPDGKTHTYAYVGHADPRLRNALRSVIFPNQAGTGLARCRWKYRDSVVSDPFFGYLEQYTLGNPNASAELKAGGTFFYVYQTLGPIKDDLNEAVRNVRVTDRTGVKTNYSVNRLGHILIEKIENKHRPGGPQAYSKTFQYNADGQLTSRIEPLGGKTDYLYANRREHAHNAGRTIPRPSEINLTSTVRFPDGRGAQQSLIRDRTVYEPIFNQPFKTISARGFDKEERTDAEKALPTEAEWKAALAARFTATYLYDYMEDVGAAGTQFASKLGLTTSQLQQLLTDAGVTDLAADVNGDTLTNQRSGNLIKIDYPDVPRPVQASRVGLSETEQAEELFRYNQFGQIVHHRDAEENVTTTGYYGANDPDGNGVLDVNVYTAGIDTGGYVREIVRDAEAGSGRNSGLDPAPVAQTTTYEYAQQVVLLEQSPSTASATFPANLLGVPTATIDPRGIKTAYLINELNQVVKTVGAAAVGARAGSEAGLTRFSYESVNLRDHNDNVIQGSIENEGTLDPAVDDLIVANRTYDILDQQKSETSNVGGGRNIGFEFEIALQYRFDPSQNLVETVRGANNPANAADHATETFAYDERDIPLVTTLGVEEGEPQQAAFENSVDANGNVTQYIDGEDADVTPGMTPAQKTAADAADGAVGGDVTKTIYDGFDRQIEVVDRVGNRTTYRYDSDSNVIQVEQFGLVDATTSGLLAKTSSRYDERNRAFRTDQHIFHYAGKAIGAIDGGALDPNDGLVSTITLYDRLDRVVGTVDAENDTHQTRYDGLSRNLTTIDPVGSSVLHTYDANSNLLTVVETEQSNLVSGSQFSESFTTTRAYDALNRIVQLVEPNGQTTTYQYDSRDNVIRTTDQLGNQTETVYDRLDREIETRTYLSDSGTGATAATKDSTAPIQSGDGIVTLKREWDDLHRLTAQIDDKDNTTRYAYDDLNRKVRTEYADTTFETWSYNDDSEPTGNTDQNQSVETRVYDEKSRLIGLTVAHPTGLQAGGTTTKTWTYDGLDRLVRATDNNGTGDGDDVIVEYTYDSLSRIIRETQRIGTRPALNVDSEWQGASREVACMYPNGRKVARSYDGLDRLFEVREQVGNALIARFEYLGASRDLRMTYGNGAVLDKRNAAGNGTIVGARPGYDSDGRSIRHEWKTATGVRITSYLSTYNGPGGVGTDRRASETREHLGAGNTDTYTFDSSYRMTGFRRDGSDIGAGGVVSTRTLDGADKMTVFIDEGDQRVIRFDEDNSESVMNQYNSFEEEGDGSRDYRFDGNGSLDNDGDFRYVQDADNRIVEIRRAADDSVVAQYTYDSNNRRVLKTAGGVTTRYVYDGWQVVEERDGNNVVVRQYVDGRGIDEHLQIKDVAAGNVFYYHDNDQGFVGALTDGTGSAVEFYEYSWLGEPTILGANQQPLPDPNPATPDIESAYSNPYFFQGRHLDPETATDTSPGLYYHRNRYYSPDVGEFLTIDPLGSWNHGQGNGFSAFGEDGWNNADPMGRCPNCTNGNCPGCGNVASVGSGGDAVASAAAPLTVQLTAPLPRSAAAPLTAPLPRSGLPAPVLGSAAQPADLAAAPLPGSAGGATFGSVAQPAASTARARRITSYPPFQGVDLVHILNAISTGHITDADTVLNVTRYQARGDTGLDSSIIRTRGPTGLTVNRHFHNQGAWWSRNE